MNENDTSPPGLLDVDLLRTFTAIVDHGSFNRAAKSIYRTPSAVSMQIKRLEENLDRSLFERGGRGITLTTDGEALLGYSRRMLRLNEEAVSHFRAPALEGTVRFGAVDDFGTRFLPDMLLRFSRSHPRVEVEVGLGTSIELTEKLSDGEFDLCLTTTDFAHSSAHAQVVHREALLWCGLQGGTAHLRRPLPLALANVGCAWRHSAMDALDRADIAYRVAYTSDHCAGQTAALLADLAVAPFPASLILPPLQVLQTDNGMPTIGDYHLELLKAPTLGPASQALAGHVEASFLQFSAGSAAHE